MVKEVAKLRSGRTEVLVGFAGAGEGEEGGSGGSGGSTPIISVDAPGFDRALVLRAVDVRRSDRGAASVDEWTGEQLTDPASVPEDIEPMEMAALGNYAVQILWPDGLNQVAPLDVLQGLPVADARGIQFDLQRAWKAPEGIELVDEEGIQVVEEEDPRTAMMSNGEEVDIPQL